jgi:hypothetical protein
VGALSSAGVDEPDPRKNSRIKLPVNNQPAARVIIERRFMGPPCVYRFAWSRVARERAGQPALSSTPETLTMS